MLIYKKGNDMLKIFNSKSKKEPQTNLLGNYIVHETGFEIVEPLDCGSVASTKVHTNGLVVTAIRHEATTEQRHTSNFDQDLMAKKSARDAYRTLVALVTQKEENADSIKHLSNLKSRLQYVIFGKVIRRL